MKVLRIAEHLCDKWLELQSAIAAHRAESDRGMQHLVPAWLCLTVTAMPVPACRLTNLPSGTPLPSQLRLECQCMIDGDYCQVRDLKAYVDKTRDAEGNEPQVVSFMPSTSSLSSVVLRVCSLYLKS